MSRKARNIEKEFRLPRLIISLCLIGLFVAYIIVSVVTKNPYKSPICKVIIFLAGVLLFTFGIVIKRQERRVDLDYDSIVVWKLCVVSGFILIGAAAFLLFL